MGARHEAVLMLGVVALLVAATFLARGGRRSPEHGILAPDPRAEADGRLSLTPAAGDRRQSGAQEQADRRQRTGEASTDVVQVAEQASSVTMRPSCTLRGVVRNASARSSSGWHLLASTSDGRNTVRIPFAPDGGFSATVDCDGRAHLALIGARSDESLIGSWTFDLPCDEEVELRVDDDSFETASILLTVDTRGIPNAEHGHLELSTSQEQRQFRLGGEFEELTLGPLKGGTYSLQLCWSGDQSELRQFLGEFVLHADDVVDAGIVRALHPGYLFAPPEWVRDIHIERFHITDRAGVVDGYPPERMASGLPIELAPGTYDLSIRTEDAVIAMGKVQIDEARTTEWRPAADDLQELPRKD